jgi:hypothetical protein
VSHSARPYAKDERKVVRYTNVTGCGKRGYLTATDARRDNRRARQAGRNGMRPYRCVACAFWHLGHLPAVVRAGLLTAAEVFPPA